MIGPYDHTGRFPWWAHRAARGGEMVVPASLARAFQAIDAREAFRKHSYFSDLAVGVISGLGAQGYELALAAAIERLKKQD